MQPISDPSTLQVGHVLYHSAFGFAQIRDVVDDGVCLAWDKKGTHLPVVVDFPNLSRVYMACTPDGFFDRAFREHEALRDILHTRPADALVWLLTDLKAPQRVRDVMDWLVGRRLFTPKTFVRWWGTAEALVKNDARLAWKGTWVRLIEPDTTTDGTKITQLEPGLIDVDQGVPREETDETLPPDEYEEDDAVPPGEPAQEPRSLSDACPSASALPKLGRALAEALATAHAEGRLVQPNVSTTVVLPDGRILLEQDANKPPVRATDPHALADDLQRAATVLLAALLGRELPHAAEPFSVLPHVRHCLPGIAPSALAPLFTALHPHPTQRPSAADWAETWRAIEAREATRDALDDAGLDLRVGYDSHVGRVKLMQTQVNQDALFVAGRGHRRVLVLCDGISVADVGRGDLASRIAVQVVGRLWEHVTPEQTSPRRLLDRALQLANRAICERVLKITGGDLHARMPMGTTVTVMCTEGNRVHLAWLGDSRAYLLGPYGAALLTADDNVSGQRFVAWCRHDARSWHARGHALVRYLGHFNQEMKHPAPFPMHYTTFVLRDDERILLCSDGITDYIESHEPGVSEALVEVTRGLDVDDACRALVSLANKRGGGDNASVIIAELARPHTKTTRGW